MSGHRFAPGYPSAPFCLLDRCRHRLASSRWTPPAHFQGSACDELLPCTRNQQRDLRSRCNADRANNNNHSRGTRIRHPFQSFPCFRRKLPRPLSLGTCRTHQSGKAKACWNLCTASMQTKEAIMAVQSKTNKLLCASIQSSPRALGSMSK